MAASATTTAAVTAAAATARSIAATGLPSPLISCTSWNGPLRSLTIRMSIPEKSWP